MKEFPLLDIRTWDYTAGDGRKVSVSMMEKDEKKHPTSSGHVVAVQITVDGHTVLAADDHISTLENFGLGEYLLNPLTHCLSSHMAEWTMWQAFADEVMVPALREDARPEEVILPESLSALGVRLHCSPLAARHIEQLTDVQSAWWLHDLDDDDDPESMEPYQHAISVLLGRIGSAAWIKLKSENEEFFSNYRPSYH